MPIALVVHGGAWAIPDDEVDEHIAGCQKALERGWEVLAGGGTALEAVEAAVRVLEDEPIFDAGIGSVLNRDGFVEMDAALMDGATLRSGGIAAVQRARHPISLARRVLESHVVLLVGNGADRFAEEVGAELADPSLFITPREQQRWETLRAQGNYRTETAFTSDVPHDTVGAVALDSTGNLAAATSTGGTSYKPAGRVGDSPLIGAGLYADNETAGASSTGWGESIIKVLLAKTATDLVGQTGDPMQAAQAAIEILNRRVGGFGGIILLDGKGRVGLAHNTPRMAFAYRDANETTVVGVESR